MMNLDIRSYTLLTKILAGVFLLMLSIPYIAPLLLYYGAPPILHPVVLTACLLFLFIFSAGPIFAISWKRWWGYIVKLFEMLGLLLLALMLVLFLFMDAPLRTLLITNTKCVYLREDVAWLSEAKQQQYRATYGEALAECAHLKQESCQSALAKFNALDAGAQKQWVARRGKPECSAETQQTRTAQ